MNLKIKFLFVVFCLISIVGFTQDKKIPIIVDGDEVIYYKEAGKVIAHGNVVIKHEGKILKCDEVEYDVNAGKAYIDGNVKVIDGDSVLTGKSGIYYVDAKKAEIKDIRMEAAPFYGEAREGARVSDSQYKLKDGYITTCELDHPHYSFTSNNITVYPEEKIVARNVFVRVKGVPLFYLPYLSQSLKDKTFGVEFSFGKDKKLGPYALTKWRYSLNEENRGKLHLDWYTHRGYGKGVSHETNTKKFGSFFVNIYHIEDKLYELRKRDSSFGQIYPERSGISPKYLEDDRYRVDISHDWKPADNLSIKSEYHKFSDAYFIKDFFERENENQSTQTYNLIDYSLPNSSLSLLTQKRVNHFNTELEYLPKLQYNFYDQSIGESPFYFQSTSSLSNMAYKTANSDVDNDASRFYAENEVSYPKKIGWLNINPYLKLHSAFYSNDINGDENIWRQAFGAGGTLSTKFYKNLKGDFNFMGEKIDRMRHVVSPEVSYAYLHDPTVLNSKIFQFDGVDSLVRGDRVVFSLDNKIQVKSEERDWNLIYLRPSVGYNVNQEGKGTYFDDIFTDFGFYPNTRLSLFSDSNYNFSQSRFTTFNTDLTFKEQESLEDSKYSITWGHRYVHASSSQETVSLKYKLTSKIDFENYFRYEADTGDVEEQQYGLKFDLHCWWLRVGWNIDKVRTYNEHKFWFVFTLKAFPERFNFGYDHTYKGLQQRF